MVACYKRLNQLEKAESLVRQLLEKQETPEYLCLLGDITSNAEYYEKAVKISDDRSARARAAIGDLMLRRKRYEDAFVNYKRSLELQPFQVRPKAHVRSVRLAAHSRLPSVLFLVSERLGHVFRAARTHFPSSSDTFLSSSDNVSGHPIDGLRPPKHVFRRISVVFSEKLKRLSQLLVDMSLLVSPSLSDVYSFSCASPSTWATAPSSWPSFRTPPQRTTAV